MTIQDLRKKNIHYAVIYYDRFIEQGLEKRELEVNIVPPTENLDIYLAKDLLILCKMVFHKGTYMYVKD